MTSSAPIGSYTPGPNRNGSLSRSSRIRALGWMKRDAGTLNPSGSSGEATRRSVVGTATRFMEWSLFVPVVAFAIVGTAAFRGFGATRLVVIEFGHLAHSPFHANHGSKPIS